MQSVFVRRSWICFRDDDEDLEAWLHRVGVDEESIGVLTRQRYTKPDVIDFVTREELMAVGIP